MQVMNSVWIYDFDNYIFIQMLMFQKCFMNCFAINLLIDIFGDNKNKLFNFMLFSKSGASSTGTDYQDRKF
jgi:hypothetical protein